MHNFPHALVPAVVAEQQQSRRADGGQARSTAAGEVTGSPPLYRLDAAGRCRSALSDAQSEHFGRVAGAGDEAAMRQLLGDQFGIGEAGVSAALSSLLCAGGELGSRESALVALRAKAPITLVDAILDHCQRSGWAEDTGVSDSVEFGAHVTPLTLAATSDNCAAVALLLARGHSIECAHRLQCGCARCTEAARHGDPVHLSAGRIAVWRALCSESHLWLSTADPLLAAFELVGDLDKCAKDYPSLEDEFVTLRQSVSAFCGRLVSQCRSGSELGRLLSRPEGVPTARLAHLHMPRLELALHCGVTDFVTAPNVQDYLCQRWLGDWRDWDTAQPWHNWLYRIAPHTVLLPITCLLYIVTLGRWPKSFGIPYARFVSYTFSYAMFLIVLLLVLFAFDPLQRRGFSQSNTEFALYSYLWVFTGNMIFWDIATFARLGFARFFSVWWHWFDFVMCQCFMHSFVLLVRSESTAAGDRLRRMHRRHWSGADAELAYEATFTVACILSFWRIFLFVQLDRSLGPCVIGIGKCVGAIMNYMLVLALIITSFAMGIGQHYEPYQRHWATSSGSGGGEQTVVVTPDRLDSFQQTLRYLYWSFYGYLGPWDMEISVGDAGPPGHRASTRHTFTQVWGETLVGLYYAITIIVLLNIMISLLVSTADYVKRHSDSEWKLVRCHLWAEFFEEAHALPPPFNIFWWCCMQLNMALAPRRRIKFSFPEMWYYECDESTADEFAQYQEFIMRLFERYMLAKEKGAAAGGDWHSHDARA